MCSHGQFPKRTPTLDCAPHCPTKSKEREGGSSEASFQPSGGAVESRSRTRLGRLSRAQDLGEDPGLTWGLCA